MIEEKRSVLAKVAEEKRVYSFVEATEVLIEEIHERLDTFVSRRIDDQPLPVIRIRLEIEEIDPLNWLAQQQLDSRIYWSERSGFVEMAGVGVADLICGSRATDVRRLIPRLQKYMGNADSDIRYYGGMRFDDRKSLLDRWDSFGAYRFVLPRIELLKHGGKTELLCNILPEKDALCVEEISSCIRSLIFQSSETTAKRVHILKRSDLPKKEDWTVALTNAIKALDSGKYDKLVLARESELQSDNKINPLDLLARLKAKTENCFHFCFEPESGSPAFIGASPERLYRREGRMIESEALAGTRPRGDSDATDAVLGEELLQTEKEQREHKHVVDSIESVFNRICRTFSVDPQPSLLKLKRVQHIVLHFSGELYSSVRDGDILSHIHPTSAVGGTPRETVRDAIREIETFDRGWYAGPVGWIGFDSAEFAVAIRSGLVDNDRLYLYSGAGIVSGSEPALEWDEIESKISGFIDAVSTE